MYFVWGFYGENMVNQLPDWLIWRLYEDCMETVWRLYGESVESDTFVGILALNKSEDCSRCFNVENMVNQITKQSLC